VGLYEDLMEHSRLHACKVLASIPTHVLVGDHDLLTPVEHAERLADAIDGATLTVVPDAGHMLPLERDELVSETLAGLIRPHL
jgi:pimeloyl-ACP methyl ester carboxylesterase